ncbi:MAG: response regulator, partial [Kangiellaceae bacterium]|nr:response regulator [Kangiellaceae bacterium]
PSAKYFVLAWLAMLFGSALMILAKLGIIPTNFITEFGTHIGSSVEAMLLSLALAAKIKSLVQKRIQAEEKSRMVLEQSNLKLQESHKIKDEFFSSLSHELRTPIHGVKGAIDLFSSCQLSNDQQDNIEILNDSVNEILNYFDHLLILSQLKSGTLEIKEDSFSLKILIQQVAKHFSDLSKERNIQFRNLLPNDFDEYLIGDMRILSVCLYQLLSKEFERENTVDITFKLEISSEDIIENATHTSDRKTMLFEIASITNPTENLCTLTTTSSKELCYNAALSRIETQFKQHKKGVLHIAQSMQDELYKKIGAEVSPLSINGNQSTQRFKLSLTSDKKLVLPKTENRSSVFTGLVVDDNKANRLIAERYLQTVGFKTKTASNGQQAIDIFNNNEIDFILMDCHMPKMNGYQAAKIIRENPQALSVPIIAITADVTQECHLACLQSGMDHVLYKPLSIRTLQQTMTRFGLISSKDETKEKRSCDRLILKREIKLTLEDKTIVSATSRDISLSGVKLITSDNVQNCTGQSATIQFVLEGNELSTAFPCLVVRHESQLISLQMECKKAAAFGLLLSKDVFKQSKNMDK